MVWKPQFESDTTKMDSMDTFNGEENMAASTPTGGLYSHLVASLQHLMMQSYAQAAPSSLQRQCNIQCPSYPMPFQHKVEEQEPKQLQGVAFLPVMREGTKLGGEGRGKRVGRLWEGVHWVRNSFFMASLLTVSTLMAESRSIHVLDVPVFWRRVGCCIHWPTNPFDTHIFTPFSVICQLWLLWQVVFVDVPLSWHPCTSRAEHGLLWKIS